MARDDGRVLRGRRGEARAAEHLRAAGYRILEQNFRCRLGEIDLVAMDGHTLVFVEVRTRRQAAHGTALATVTASKQQRLARVAQFYLQRRQPRFDACRFDVIGITAGRLQHVEDAFRLGLLA